MNELSALDILRHPQSGDNSDVNETMQYVVKALEKQIPKKPKEDGWLYCPVCGGEVLTNRYKYCPDCGQALDWNDSDDECI